MGGRFITLEGGEGSGKSTQAKRLAAALEAKGMPTLTTREPGGSPGAEEIRALLVQGEPGRWDPLTETLLLYAARADHVRHVIGPALRAGKWVISDRFNDSSFVYQGIGRGVARETIRRIDSVVLDDFKPDFTLVLDIDVDTGLKRAGARGGKENRFENFDRDFHERLRQGFIEIAKRHPDRCALIDAAGTPDEVAAAIWATVSRRFSL
ncbi:MAG TPA: dTMP kinase [Rhizomicrobium sp.]|nr:dTMP kinase [Rhizomicrobium sp.]